MNEFRGRLKKLDKLKGKCDAVLLMNFDEPFKDVNYFYFTGNDSTYSVFLYDFSEVKIITNSLEMPKVRSETWIRNIISVKKKYSETLRKELDGCKKIGISGSFPYFLAKKLKFRFVDISEDLENIRAIKSKSEIENIRKACKVSDRIMDGLRTLIKPNISEKEIAQFLKMEVLKNGCDIPPLEPIVNSGRKTSIPHETQPDRKIAKNDIVMVDYSAVCGNYYSDCTRMFFIGKVDKKVKQQHELLKNIIAEAYGKIHIGMKACDVDNLIRKRLGLLSKNFIHSTGHGVGLALHENPSVSEKSNDILREGMVFTIEPGVYFKDYGLRIEDTVLLTGKGIKVLTKTGKY